MSYLDHARPPKGFGKCPHTKTSKILAAVQEGLAVTHPCKITVTEFQSEHGGPLEQSFYTCENLGMTNCQVKGCPESVDDYFVFKLDPRMEVAACAFHFQALSAGDSFAFDKNSELLIGSHGPLEIVRMRSDENLSGRFIRLELGHDGVVSQTVSFREPERSAWETMLRDVYGTSE